MCHQHGIPTSGSTSKHELVKLIAEQEGSTEPPPVILYSGQLSRVPTTVSGLNRLTVPQLRAILHHHNVVTLGVKDELVMSFPSMK